jgi:hypothetical protein
MNKIAVSNPFDKSIDVNSFASQRDVFVNSFIGNKHIFCYNNNPKVKLSGMNHTSNIDEVINANVNDNSDAYFYVNGCRKKDDIKVVSACYIDLDAGRDTNGKYHSPTVVMKTKEQFIEKINKFGVRPSWVVDTRNGYQVYWILNEHDHKLRITSNKKYWNGIQKKLANYFNADIRAMKINQIFRVPFTWWRKPWEGKASYFSTLLSGYNGKTVSIVKLQEALTGQSAQIHVKSVESSDAWYEKIRNSPHTENSVPIKEEVVKEIMKELMHKADTVITENEDIPDYDEDTNDIIPSRLTHNIPSDEEMKLLTNVVNFLNQVATPLFFSNNKFLSSSARELANKISDHFCVG